jgi:two-component system chemotaxis sensor kinase CheA
MAQIDGLINMSASLEVHTSVNTSLDQELTAQKAVSTFYIRFKPNKDILTNGTNPLYLMDELHALGTCKAYPQLKAIPSLEEFNPSQCYTSWNIFLSTDLDENAIKDVFIFVEDDCLLEIHTIADDNLLENEEFIKKIQESETVEEEVDIARLISYAQSLKKEVNAHISIPKEIHTNKDNAAMAAKEQVISSIRVSSEKLDDLMNLVSELVTTQARLSLFAENNTLPELMTIAENVEKISRQLRDNTFSICLIPLESMLVRFQRLVRDLSAELGKDIILVTEGAETELDKSIIESLADPLLHILRNSIDHGIEDMAVRQQKGKPKQGKILLKAFYSGSNVYIQIQDDGAGIDPGKIREKAISKGIISAEAQLSEREILDLIFLPGFSTAAKVTDVSGRGVGMDVVRRKISEIRGEAEIKSQLGIGTTITIKLPVTLSIIDGLLVKIEDTHFVIPLSVVDKCYEAIHSQLVDSFNNLITLDGEKIPFFYLRNEFEMPQSGALIEQVVIVKYEDKSVGLSVDAIIGEYQAVLKPLGKLYKNQELISGATILGDGTIALVMDTNKMIKKFSREATIATI